MIVRVCSAQKIKCVLNAQMIFKGKKVTNASIIKRKEIEGRFEGRSEIRSLHQEIGASGKDTPFLVREEEGKNGMSG